MLHYNTFITIFSSRKFSRQLNKTYCMAVVCAGCIYVSESKLEASITALTKWGLKQIPGLQKVVRFSKICEGWKYTLKKTKHIMVTRSRNILWRQSLTYSLKVIQSWVLPHGNSKQFLSLLIQHYWPKSLQQLNVYVCSYYTTKKNLQHNAIPVYSEVSPILLNGAYSQVSLFTIPTLNKYGSAYCSFTNPLRV